MVGSLQKELIEEMLAEAGVGNDPKARAHLNISLNVARALHLGPLRREAPPTQLLKQLARSISKTDELLAKLEKHPHWRDIGFQMHGVGEGVVEVKMVDEMKWGPALELPRDPASHDRGPKIIKSGRIAGVHVRAVLWDLRDEIVRPLKTLRRGNPGAESKDAILFYANDYFQRHSKKKLSQRFLELFCEHVTGTEASLEWQVRKVRKSRQTN